MRKTINIMKQTQLLQSIKLFMTKFPVLAVAALLVITPALTIQPRVYADRYDDQIQAIEQEINGFESQASQLQGKANSLKNALKVLANQKAAIQAKIELSQAKHDKLVVEIKKTEKDIRNNQDILGSTVADLYVDSSLTPIEMLASSNSIGDYVDKQEYRTAVREQLEASIRHIKELKQQLTTQKVKIENLLAQQKQQKQDLAAKESERSTLLAQTRGQEQQYRSLIAKRSSEIAKVRQEQAAAYASYNASHGGNVAVPGDPNRGGYPAVWANAPQDSLVDNWGMYNRECVSYAAWRVYSGGKYMPNWAGRGDAYQWIYNAQSSEGQQLGISARRGEPRIGTIAAWDQNYAGIGFYGHVAYVERVNSDRSIWVSQYNFTHGAYSEMKVSASEAAGLWYISFPSQ
jgi:peptidoglycan hydrolase CwlO-like protein